MSCACKASRKIDPLPNSCARNFDFLFFDARNLYMPFRIPSFTSPGIAGITYGSFINVM